MYTWGYIKNAALAKLDMDDYSDQSEPMELGLINRFSVYANEAMTQICSSVKPKRKFYELEICKEDIGKIQTITDTDFIAFSDDNSTHEYYDFMNNYWSEHCHDDVLEYIGYNQFICKDVGTYKIAYNARWFDFQNVSDNTIIPVPNDILDCIPSYIAHQCYKIDDEYKSSVFRNEYEMFLARIDNTDFKNTHTIKIEGDW